jgi:hypothetical protein
MNEKAESVSRSSNARRRNVFLWILWRFSRLAVLLLAVFMAACVMVAQPSFRSNSPSTKLADADRLRKHVVALSESFHPRDSENPANLDRSAEYIAAEFTQAGADVEFQEVPVQGRMYRNVIGRIGRGKARKLIIGAHYDAFDGTPGADDNASGVAGLLELARMLGADPPDAEIELVGYTLEEPPFFGGEEMGSTVHAASAAKEKSRIVGVIVLEMIGYFSDVPGSQSYPLPILKGYYPDRGNFITVVSRWDQGDWISDLKAAMKGTTALPVYSFRGPASLPGVDFSDHRNYWPHGIPAAMVTNTAFFRNTAYHGPEDIADRLDYKRMAMVVVGVFEAVRKLALSE